MDKKAKIYVAGHKGMVGSAIVRKLEQLGYTNIIVRTSRELDLKDQSAVESFFKSESPEYVFMAAAKVGGILANNTFRAEFLYDNLMMESNVIHQSYRTGVKKLLFLGSSCIYPKLATQPLKESELLSGYLEPTNEPYAIAKIAGIKLCETYRDQYGCNFISAMPTNLYGPNDNYDLQTSHVLPALLRKFNESVMSNTTVTVWGSGKPLREFMHVDDMADACVFLMLNYDGKEFVNVGSGEEVSIFELATLIKEITGYSGEIIWDRSKPDGTPRKLMDVSKLRRLGWTHKIDLRTGIKQVYETELQGAR
jgi:GDP-L-fucose synthase